MIQQIQKSIAELFNTYKIPALTQNLSMEDLGKWADIVSKKLRLDPDFFYPKAAEFFWALSHVQLAIGYALVARQSCEFPKGKSGISFDESGVPDLLDICDMHFWYHAFCVRECIYRCWERLASLLSAACCPNLPEKNYFDGIVEKIEKDSDLNRIPELKLLKKQIKHWNNAASARNKLSHRESSPFTRTKITVELTNLIGADGQVIPKYHYSSDDILQEIEKLKNAYLRLQPAFMDVSKFIEKYSESRTSR